MDTTINSCDVCGINEFINRDGYFFCAECGTQAANVRELAAEDEYIQGMHRTTTKKIKFTKKDEVELTTWECVNYILLGLVNELNNLGANDELKLKTFQLWAEFLRKNEIAFFASKKKQLPKLNAYFKSRDAKILFNHAYKRKRRKSDSGTSGGESSIGWRSQRRKYDKAEYAKNYSDTDLSLATLMSSSQVSNTSSHGIELNLKDSARKILKKIIRPQHLKRHETDFEKTMDCDCVPIIRDSVAYSKRMTELYNRKTVYSILYLALNLSNDKIQLYDLVRFMKDGSLPTKNFLNFFPENIRKSCEKVLSCSDFPKYSEPSAISIRKQATVICKLLSIRKLNTPNLVSLCYRFCKDFMLPQEFIFYVERLINYFPPQMNYITDTTPFYEGRVVAYIIFVLKFLFGLDDVKEEKISESAIKINKILKNFCERKLFVWRDWMQYIETRKLILSKYDLCYFDFNKNFKNFDTFINKISGTTEVDEEYVGLNRANVLNMNHIFENFLKDCKRTQPHSNLRILSFTPQIDYFERILYDPPSSVIITDRLKFDHSSTEINPFLNPKQFKNFFENQNINLHIFKDKGNENVNFVETFCYKTTSNLSLFSIESISEAENETDKYNKIYNELLDTDFLKSIEKTKLKSKPKNNAAKSSSLSNRCAPVDEKSIFHDISDSYSSSDDSDCFENEDENVNLKFCISNQEYWILHGKLNIKEEDFNNVKKHMPKNFLWLLETFASYLETDTELLYEELMIIENQFFYIIEDIENVENDILLKKKKIDTNKKGTKFSKYFSKLW